MAVLVQRRASLLSVLGEFSDRERERERERKHSPSMMKELAYDSMESSPDTSTMATPRKVSTGSMPKEVVQWIEEQQQALKETEFRAANNEEGVVMPKALAALSGEQHRILRYLVEQVGPFLTFAARLVVILVLVLYLGLGAECRLPRGDEAGGREAPWPAEAAQAALHKAVADGESQAAVAAEGDGCIAVVVSVIFGRQLSRPCG